MAIGGISLYSALIYTGNIYKLITRGDGIYLPIIGVPFAMAILGFRTRKAVVFTTMFIGGIYGIYASYSASSTFSGAITKGMVASMAISVFTLVVGHYIAPRLPNTGWVGIKDPSAVELQNQETRRWWMQQLCNFKMLFTQQYRVGLFPKKESAFVGLGAYFIFSALLALCFMQKEYLFPYIYWYMAVMAIGTTLVIYPSFEVYKREPSLVYFVWPVLLFMLLFVSSIQFMKLGHYNPMLCALLI
ncbi:hypothetical protein [Cardinium endosymbiont of Tipula unca]|uniref:hypothetical protein n=1 Tax=Cardinium endosymbiont of Tipula unca TaxID=3066216 RepID=UPI0030CB076B